MEPELPEFDESISFTKSKLTIRTSNRILENYPITESEVTKLFDPEELEGGDIDNFFVFCNLLLKVWRYCFYYQVKPEKLANQLEEKHFPTSVIKGILEVWSSDQIPKIFENLASFSFSGVPKVKDTQWISQKVLARNGVEVQDEHQAILLFETTSGPQRVQLSAKQLEELYWTTNKIQKSLDNLLEHR
ncbi:unnamed protein product [Caenorhabditis angaria]|uniref:COMM domain-containing protein n=1 Tax=Caenorhabditis angaria TaxID=860376 RepID=A0A9P1IZA0_9PELO|nr:unnamed protein product [Caenorhabditis angaria]